MTATDANQSGKTWELSLYELQRTPQNIITDSTEIAVSVRSLHSELMCPICLDMLKETMTTKECLHRFCHDCIITALRAGNKECPTCRKKLISKRSLREDRNFDAFISRIYPNREDYELQQERVMAKVSKHNFAQNIEETQRMQAMNRARGNNKRNSSAQEPAIERDSVPERNLKPGTPLSLVSDESSEPDGQYEFDNATTTDGESTTGEDTGEIELVIKPLPQVIRKDSSQTQTRYIKTTIWAQVSHIAKYLEMRYDFEGAFPQMESNGYANGENNIPEPDNVPPTGDSNNSKDSTENGSSTSSSTIISNGSNNNQNQRTIPHEFTMYIAGGPGQFNPVQGNLSLAEVHEKFWRVNKPLELYYAYKMEPSVEKTTTGKNGTTTHKTW